jgi:hypothetical protein
VQDPYSGAGNLVVPDFLRGYRCWRLNKDSLELYPLHVNLGPWREGKLQAYCSSDPNRPHYGISYGAGYKDGNRPHRDDWVKTPAPQASCTCGIYATYKCEGYRYQLPNFWSYNPGPSRIVHGCIKATGRAILGESGFRAQKAEIEALWGLGAQSVARIYEIPWFLTRRKFLKHFPPHDVSGLLEENPDEGTVRQRQ